jgi:hypothetical protein
MNSIHLYSNKKDPSDDHQSDFSAPVKKSQATVNLSLTVAEYENN